MSVEFKLVPVDPIHAIDMGWAYLDAARKAEPNRNWAFSHSGYRAMIAAAPVPPLGRKPEVVAVIDETDSPFPETAVTHRPGIESMPVGTELVDRAHVTQLQAEVDRKETLITSLLGQVNTACGQRDALQSELTKARELLADAMDVVLCYKSGLGYNYASCDDGGKRRWLQIEKIEAALSSQSAPATTVTTDCRSDVGVTVGLIDAVITMSRLLKGRSFASSEVQEAMADLLSDEDFAAIKSVPAAKHAASMIGIVPIQPMEYDEP